MLDHASDYGPFAATVGYAGAIIAAATAMFAVWAGKMEKWRPPEEDIPGGGRAIILLLCGVGVVLQWYFASPETVNYTLIITGILAIMALTSFLRYSNLIGTYTYCKKIPINNNSTRDVRVLGGQKLLEAAEKKRVRQGIDVQTLFAGAAYRPDLLWSKESQQWVKQRVLLFFIATLVFGTSTLTGASFATQVLISKKAAVSITNHTLSSRLRLYEFYL